MPRKRKSVGHDQLAPAAIGTYVPPPSPALNRQSRYAREPWKPGEIPAGTLREVHSGPARPGPYGEALGVQPPEARGAKLPRAPGFDDSSNPPSDRPNRMDKFTPGGKG